MKAGTLGGGQAQGSARRSRDVAVIAGVARGTTWGPHGAVKSMNPGDRTF